MTSISLNSNSLFLENFILQYSIVIIPNISKLKTFIDYSEEVDLKRIRLQISVTDNNVVVASRIFNLKSESPFVYLKSTVGDKILNIDYYYEDIHLTKTIPFTVVNNIYPAFQEENHLIVYQPCYPVEDNFEIYAPYVIDIYNRVISSDNIKVYFRFLDVNNNIIPGSERLYLYRLISTTPSIQYTSNDLGLENFYIRIVDFERFYRQTVSNFLSNILKDYSGNEEEKISQLSLIMKRHLEKNLKGTKTTFNLK